MQVGGLSRHAGGGKVSHAMQGGGRLVTPCRREVSHAMQEGGMFAMPCRRGGCLPCHAGEGEVCHAHGHGGAMHAGRAISVYPHQ